ncbi:hypothetical protein [Candidatus Thioglobus sp.]|uniref:hypothetical protein n=1 Tax=Candidatus Thioglobus sp. TaxID=2026721 RepID=UPI003D11C356
MSFNTFKRTIDVVTTTTEYADTSKDLSGSGFEVIPKILNIFKQVFKALWWVVKGAASLFWFSLENSATAETEKYDLNMDDWNTPKNKSSKRHPYDDESYIEINGCDTLGNKVRF